MKREPQGGDWAAAREAYRGRRALVLGASGFIGGWAVRMLLEAGAEVIAAGRQGTRSDGCGGAGAGAGVAVVRADLADGERAAAVVGEVKPDIVFNLAGYGVAPGQADEVIARRVNADLVRVLAGALARAPAGSWPGLRLVHAGSGFEYGEIGGDLAEDSEPAPRTVYARTKLEGTRALAAACAGTGLRAAAIRPFTVYGPGEHPHRLLPSLMRALRSDEPVELSAGTQRRDFVYVRDVVEAMLRIGLLRDPCTGVVLNVATGVLHSVREFAQTAGAVLGIEPSRLRFGAIPTRGKEMEHGPVSVARLRARTGWIPGTGIADGIAATRDSLAARTTG